MKYYTKVGDFERVFEFRRREGVLRAVCNGENHVVDLSPIGDGSAFSLIVDGRSYDCLIDREKGRAVVQLFGERIVVEVEDERERTAHRVAGHQKGGGRRAIEAVMPGVVVDVKIAEGDVVEDGQTLLVLEAMKMQNPITADGPGRVVRVAVRKGKAVAGGAVLVELDESADE